MSEIVPSEGGEPLSFDQFKYQLDSKADGKTALEKVSDLTSGVPAILRVLSKLDPTGLVDQVFSVLDENREKREKDVLYKALYALYAGIKENEKRIALLVKEKVSPLTETYLEQARKNNGEGIAYLQKAYLTGVFDSTSSVTEDIRMLELINSLTRNEINILIFVFSRLKDFSYQEMRHGQTTTANVEIHTIKESLGLSESLAIEAAMSLLGRGLLEDFGIGRLDYPGPRIYIINEFSRAVVRYATGESI